MPHGGDALQQPLDQLRLLALRRRRQDSRLRPPPAAGFGPSAGAGCFDTDLMAAQAGRLPGGASASTAGPTGPP